MQARLALEHGRPVFLLESLLEHQWAQDYAERPGVYVVAGTDEVVGRLERLYPAELVVAS
jgi:DNA processing protein